MSEAVIHETETAPPTQGRTPEGSAQSCRNAIRDGCRSITEFPIDMQQRIDVRYAERCAELEPKTSLERELILEMARAEIQKDVAHRLLHDRERIRQAVEETWDEDQRRHTNNLAARLPRDPQRVAELLLQTKHGAEWALTQWRGLAASARQNHGLTEPQRQLVLDLKGVSPLLRDNTDTVPAASDEAGLLALIAREVKALERRLCSSWRAGTSGRGRWRRWGCCRRRTRRRGSTRATRRGRTSGGPGRSSRSNGCGRGCRPAH
jgi:hypothetical protein